MAENMMELDNHENAKESFIDLNELFSYGVDGNCAHIHVMHSMGEMLMEKGHDYTLEYFNEMLYDALQKLISISESNPKIEKVFAVSPNLASDPVRRKFEMYGFKTEKTTDPNLCAFFPNERNIVKATIPMERLKRVIGIEKETREGIDKYDTVFAGSYIDRILSYKYDSMKKEGITDYYNISLAEVIEAGKRNYRFRHGLPIVDEKRDNKPYKRNLGQRDSIFQSDYDDR